MSRPPPPAHHGEAASLLGALQALVEAVRSLDGETSVGVDSIEILWQRISWCREAVRANFADLAAGLGPALLNLVANINDQRPPPPALLSELRSVAHRLTC